MKRVFADTYYWIALLNDRDQGHGRAQSISDSLENVMLITSQEVLAEVLTHFSGHGGLMRRSVAAFVRAILDDPTVAVRSQTDRSFLAGLAFYEARADKAYSLTDCISMQVMHEEGINEVLTHDRHFAQEGFSILL